MLPTGNIQDMCTGALSGACNQVFSSAFSTGDRMLNLVSVLTDLCVFVSHYVMPLHENMQLRKCW